MSDALRSLEENSTKPQQQKDICRGEVPAQGANGFDLSMFRESLRRTPTERIEHMQRALLIAMEVKRAGRAYRLSQRNRTTG